MSSVGCSQFPFEPAEQWLVLTFVVASCPTSRSLGVASRTAVAIYEKLASELKHQEEEEEDEEKDDKLSN